MRSIRLSSALVASVLFAAGCERSGLSYREYRGQTQGAYLNQLLATQNAASLANEPASFRSPASLAVAQVGEVAPPLAMMSKLLEHGSLFRRVEAIPAVSGDAWRRDVHDSAAQSEINSLRAMAGSLGMDYLLLVGGTVDEIHNATPLSMLNLTIVGAFIVPSHRTTATMKASGALIDVRTGRIVSISNAQAKDEQVRPLASAEGDMDRRLETMREEVAVALADAVAVDCQKIGAAVMPSNLSPVQDFSSTESPASTPTPQRFVPLSKRSFQGR